MYNSENVIFDEGLKLHSLRYAFLRIIGMPSTASRRAAVFMKCGLFSFLLKIRINPYKGVGLFKHKNKKKTEERKKIKDTLFKLLRKKGTKKCALSALFSMRFALAAKRSSATAFGTLRPILSYI